MSEYYVGDRPTPGGSGDGGDASVKDKAAASAQVGKQAAGEVAQTAVSKAQDVVGEGATQARNVLSEARDQLSGHVGEQHANAVTNLHALGDELKSMAQSGQQSDQAGPATDLVGKAADRAHSTAAWLDDRTPADLVDELRRFARNRPAAFVAGAVVAGVLAGRLTRGAIAAHSDDTDRGSNAFDAQPHTEPMPLPGYVGDPGRHAIGTEYPPGYGTGGAADVAGQLPPDPYANPAGPGGYEVPPAPGEYGGQPGQYGGQAVPGQYGGQPEWDPVRYPGSEGRQ